MAANPTAALSNAPALAPTVAPATMLFILPLLPIAPITAPASNPEITPADVP